MALNPFFLQGSQSEQRLVQQLINEQLKMYGVEVTYIPRKFVKKDSILREIQSSKFDDNFLIEAYVNTYEGYSGAGDILTKFGMSLRDELVITISKERFEDFISPFLEAGDDNEIVLSSRPREGDLVYFPLGQRIFEVKFVEHEQPFYQLGKNYVYELKCELFEYEDEVIDTSIEEIDTQIKDDGFITTLNLIGVGATAIFTSNIETGYVRKIYLNNDGYGYTSTPIVGFSSSPATGGTATAVAITTSIAGVRSIKEILLTNAGFGYTVAPVIRITGGGGSGAAATCSIETVNKGVVSFNIEDSGSGYTSTPVVTIGGPGVGITAIGVANITSGNIVSAVRLRDPGIGYETPPSVTIANPPLITGIGTYLFNEEVVGSTSGARARVKSWDKGNGKLKISIISGDFSRGETIVGASSSAIYSVNSYDDRDIYDKYSENDEIEQEADLILDFSQSNPFGNY